MALRRRQQVPLVPDRHRAAFQAWLLPQRADNLVQLALVYGRAHTCRSMSVRLIHMNRVVRMLCIVSSFVSMQAGDLGSSDLQGNSPEHGGRFNQHACVEGEHHPVRGLHRAVQSRIHSVQSCAGPVRHPGDERLSLAVCGDRVKPCSVSHVEISLARLIGFRDAKKVIEKKAQGIQTLICL